MDDAVKDVMESVRQEADARAQALGRILAGADSARVFGQAITSGEYTVIPAAEIASGGGFGSGMGFNALSGRRKKEGADQSQGMAGEGGEAGELGSAGVQGAGGGGGGGGGAMGRPVAVIVVGPEGVKVKPVMDMTKLVMTALGAWGTVAALSVRMWSKK